MYSASLHHEQPVQSRGLFARPALAGHRREKLLRFVARNNTESRIFPHCIQAPGLFNNFYNFPGSPRALFNPALACARKGQVCPPTSIRFVASVCFYLKVLGAKLDHHTRVKKDFLGLCRFRILGPLIALNEVSPFDLQGSRAPLLNRCGFAL